VNNTAEEQNPQSTPKKIKLEILFGKNCTCGRTVIKSVP